MMQIIVAGSRTITDKDVVHEFIDDFLDKINFIKRDKIEILEGGAHGVDALASVYAYNNGLALTTFRADWDKHGKRAGYIRNEDMARTGDALCAIWDGKSRGTKHMIDMAIKYGLLTKVYYYYDPTITT